MSTTSILKSRVNYPEPRSIRGELDPPEASPKLGWRYVQCTDKLHELRVLIPPRTSLIYDSLLRAEKIEIAKGDVASSELRYIRHLKDRMIRKCHRLCNWIPPADPSTAVSQERLAPGDFRLKEMEQWWLFKQLPAEENMIRNSHLRVRRKGSSTSKPSSTSKTSPSVTNGAPRSRRSSRSIPLAESYYAPKSVQAMDVTHVPAKVSSRDSGSKSTKVDYIPPRETKVNTTGREGKPYPPSSVPTPRKLQKRPPPVVLHNNHVHNSQPTPIVSPPVSQALPSKHPSIVGTPLHVSEASPPIRSPATPGNFNYTSYFEQKSSPKPPSVSPGTTRRLSSGAPAHSPPGMSPTMKLQAQYESQYKTSGSFSSPPRVPSNTALNTMPEMPSSYARSRHGSEDRMKMPVPQQIPGYSSSGSSRHTGSSSHSSQQQVSPKPAPSRSHDAQVDESYLRRQQRASSMPHPQNTDFYPSLDASMNSPPLADRTHGRRATVDNGYGHERTQTVPSHRSSHLGPVPLVDNGQGRYPYYARTSFPQAVPGLASHSRPLNAASPSASADLVYEIRTSPSLTQTSAVPHTHRGSADIGIQKSVRKSNEAGSSPPRFDPSVNVSSHPSPQQQVLPQRRVDKTSPYPMTVEPSPPIAIYRGGPYVQSQPEHHVSPVPPPVQIPDCREPYAPISLSKPSPSSSRRSSLQVIGPESLTDSFNSHLELGEPHSRPLSRLSTVSDPVIPDASLLVEAAVLRGREKPFRPRLYDYASSESPFGSDDESEDDDDDDDDRPARPRSRGSMRSVRSSRSAGDPGPSILKRSGSRCSQRSSKSVRLDIPEDQEAVLSVRQLQDDVYNAGLKVEEARHRWDRGEEGAELAFKDAQRSLRDMYARLREKEESFRRLQAAKKSERKEYVNRYVAQ